MPDARTHLPLAMMLPLGLAAQAWPPVAPDFAVVPFPEFSEGAISRGESSRFLRVERALDLGDGIRYARGEMAGYEWAESWHVLLRVGDSGRVNEVVMRPLKSAAHAVTVGGRYRARDGVERELGREGEWAWVASADPRCGANCSELKFDATRFPPGTLLEFWFRSRMALPGRQIRMRLELSLPVDDYRVELRFHSTAGRIDGAPPIERWFGRHEYSPVGLRSADVGGWPRVAFDDGGGSWERVAPREDPGLRVESFVGRAIAAVHAPDPGRCRPEILVAYLDRLPRPKFWEREFLYEIRVQLDTYLASPSRLRPPGPLEPPPGEPGRWPGWASRQWRDLRAILSPRSTAAAERRSAAFHASEDAFEFRRLAEAVWLREGGVDARLVYLVEPCPPLDDGIPFPDLHRFSAAIAMPSAGGWGYLTLDGASPARFIGGTAIFIGPGETERRKIREGDVFSAEPETVGAP